MKYLTKISGYWEKTYPYVLGFIAAFALYKFEPSVSEKRMDALLSASINVSAILMGFLGTSKAMLLSFRSAKTHWLSKNPVGWCLLLSYFRHAITLSLLVCVLSFLLTALEVENKYVELSFYIFVFWASTLIATLAAFYRVLGIFFKLLK